MYGKTATLPGLFVCLCLGVWADSNELRCVKCRRGAADGSSTADRVAVSHERVKEELHGANLKSRLRGTVDSSQVTMKFVNPLLLDMTRVPKLVQRQNHIGGRGEGGLFLINVRTFCDLTDGWDTTSWRGQNCVWVFYSAGNRKITNSWLHFNQNQKCTAPLPSHLALLRELRGGLRKLRSSRCSPVAQLSLRKRITVIR